MKRARRNPTIATGTAAVDRIVANLSAAGVVLDLSTVLGLYELANERPETEFYAHLPRSGADDTHHFGLVLQSSFAWLIIAGPRLKSDTLSRLVPVPGARKKWMRDFSNEAIDRLPIFQWGASFEPVSSR